MKAVFFSEEYSDQFVHHYLKPALLFLLLLFSFASPVKLFSQTKSLNFVAIPESAPDIISPGRGAEQWNNGTEAIDYPLQGAAQQSLDVYYRFTWNRLEGATQGSYDWNFFDGLVRDAINKGQKFSFGIMSCYPDGGDNPGMVNFDNGSSAYPEYLHRLMQTEAEPDWKTDGNGAVDGYGSWVPNWNSPYYLERLKALHEALYAHINSSSYTAGAGPHSGETIAFRDVIFSIDVRGYGSWGEWHSAGIINTMSNYPAGRRATTATLKTIIDHHVNVFTDHPLSIMIAAFDAEQLSNTDNPKEIAAYALEISNKWGKLGWRRDSWGAIDPYLEWYLKGNQQSFGNSGLFGPLISERWKLAPITGEPPRWMASLYGQCEYDDLERQVRDYHVTSIGNGNFGSLNPPDCVKDNIRTALKTAGYRIILESGTVNSTLRAGGIFNVTLNWKNTGIAPSYEKWNVSFELKNSSGEIAWSGVSQFNPGQVPGNAGLLPSATATTIKDNFVLPANTLPGDYTLNIIIKDPAGYRAPFPLAIQGRNDDGSYTLTNVQVDTSTSAPIESPIDTTVIPPTLPPTIPPTIPPTDPSTDPPPTTGGDTDECPAIAASIGAIQVCNGEPVELKLNSATGEGPFDLVINGTEYTNIPVGGTITTFNPINTTVAEKIWPGDQNPTTHEDNRAVELGVKFTSSVNGFINGVRFYSPTSVDGIYTGHLWDANGTLLASATFNNVTADGWQEVLFDEPVAIEASAVYTASYHTTAGVYVATSGGLSAPVGNGVSLTTSGGGVYTYEQSAFPAYTFNATNYWVDVIFSTGNHEFELMQVTDNNGCQSTQALQTLTVSSVPCTQQRSSVTAQAAEKTTAAKPETQAVTIHSNSLAQNYPNPFTAETIITFTLARPADVNLSLFDINGRAVKVLVNGKREAGSYNISVNKGSLSRGLYFYKLRAGDFSATKRMIIQ